MKIIPNTHIPRIGFTFKYPKSQIHCKIIREEIINSVKYWRYEHGGLDKQSILMYNILNSRIVIITKQEYENFTTKIYT